MSVAVQVEQGDMDFSLNLTVNQAGTGGVTGLAGASAPTVAIRDGTTTDSYLDFADDTFKTSGWTTKFSPLSEVENGHYTLSFDVSALSLSPGDVLVAEYAVDDGGDVVGDAHDILTIVDSLTSREAEAQANVAYNDTTAVLTAAVWMDRGGKTVTTPTSATITLRDQANAVVFGPTVSAAPFTTGVFIFSVSSVALLDNQVYNLEVTVVDGAGSATTNQSIATVA